MNNFIEIFFFQSLNFQELQYLHTKTCEATAKLLGRGDVPTIVRDNQINIPERDETKMLAIPTTPCTEKDLMKRSKNAQSQGEYNAREAFFLHVAV